jgi:hypothetical protein
LQIRSNYIRGKGDAIEEIVTNLNQPKRNFGGICYAKAYGNLKGTKRMGRLFAYYFRKALSMVVKWEQEISFEDSIR